MDAAHPARGARASTSAAGRTRWDMKVGYCTETKERGQAGPEQVRLSGFDHTQCTPISPFLWSVSPSRPPATAGESSSDPCGLSATPWGSSAVPCSAPTLGCSLPTSPFTSPTLPCGATAFTFRPSAFPCGRQRLRVNRRRLHSLRRRFRARATAFASRPPTTGFSRQRSRAARPRLRDRRRRLHRERRRLHSVEQRLHALRQRPDTSLHGIGRKDGPRGFGGVLRRRLGCGSRGYCQMPGRKQPCQLLILA